MSDVAFPPVEPPPFEAEAPPSKWPTVIGVISLIYAILGMLCGLGYAVSTLLSKQLMAMGGMNIEPPPIFGLIAIVMGGSTVVLGIVMVVGAVGLLRRRHNSLKILRTWAMLRMILIVVGLAVTFFTAPAQIQFQKSIAEAQAQQLRDAGRADRIPPEKSDEEHWKQIVMMSGIMSAVMAIYPGFIIFYLSRRKIIAEAQTWR